MTSNSLFIGFWILLALTLFVILLWNYRRQYALKVRRDLDMLVPGLSKQEYWRLYRKCETEEGRQRITDLVSTEVDGESVILEEDLPPFLRKDLSLCPYCEQEIDIEYILDILGDEYQEIEIIEFDCPHCGQRVVSEIEHGFAIWDMRKVESV